MNWEVIAIVSQVASAFAIVITLVYLASENRQSNSAAAINTTIKGTELASHWRAMLVNDAGLADALARANADDIISPAESLRLNIFFDDLFILAGAIEANGVRSGALHGVRANVAYVHSVFQENPSMIPRWQSRQSWMELFAPDFARTLNKKLVQDA
jgi:hypothetical protein